MEFKDNLIRLRKENGWSQEELGYRLDVSRQTVSKWESGDTTPEMEKLKKLGELFSVSLDDLVSARKQGPLPQSRRLEYEYKSSRTLGGWPLVHINLGTGLKTARGIVAVGNIAIGAVAVGALSLGIVSLGVIAAGIVVLAALGGGVISLGAIAGGVLAAAGIAMGWIAAGGVAMGTYALGGVALGSRIAMGGYARGEIAIGEQVEGVLEFPGGRNFQDIDFDALRIAITDHFPDIQEFILDLFTGFPN